MVSRGSYVKQQGQSTACRPAKLRHVPLSTLNRIAYLSGALVTTTDPAGDLV
jgi:hypothetical protein